MKRVALAEVKDHLSEYLRDASKEEVIITRHGKPAGVLIGFANEEDWFEYRLAHDPGFQKRIARARSGLQAGKGIGWDEVQKESEIEESIRVSDRPSRRKSRK
ncbi:MAG: type II toxin-antitoxin system Phd/YefM family antitoxin [candidate division WOR-3 bacterium]|nr:MAG: type II toxin-antitoxin system Phd/YefM family antitoxin [candidate division WOR-3 bacterium]